VFNQNEKNSGVNVFGIKLLMIEWSKIIQKIW